MSEGTSLPLEAFAPEEREELLAQAERYDALLKRLPAATPGEKVGDGQRWGILALNGASGAGQSYVMARVERLLRRRSIELPRIYLLGTRPPRPGEGHKNPYIFVRQTPEGWQDIHHPERIYTPDDIYYFYESRPGAGNAILRSDMEAARRQLMYLETVIPTLLHIKETAIAGFPPWGDALRIVYLAVPGGREWLARLLNREPERLGDVAFRKQIMGRVASSLADMELAVVHEIPCVLNRHGQGERAAHEVLAAWGLEEKGGLQYNEEHGG